MQTVTHTLFLLLLSLATLAQDLTTPFKSCNLTGSITIYDHKKGKWLTNDEMDSRQETQPASTFKIINLLIALQTGGDSR
nr:hypothetical protein [Dyadobacter crusticola]